MKSDFSIIDFIITHKDYETRPAGKNQKGQIREQILLSWIERERKVLDVGCREGILGQQVQKKGCHVTGVEIDREIALKTRDRLHKVVIGNIERKETLSSLDRDYAIIICADILEHLIQPQKTLISLKNHLTTEGKILICIPNIAHWSIRSHLLFGRFDYTKRGILDETHLRFFTRHSFTRVLKEANLRIIASDFIYAESPLDKIKDEKEKWKIINKYRESFALQYLFAVKKRVE